MAKKIKEINENLEMNNEETVSIDEITNNTVEENIIEDNTTDTTIEENNNEIETIENTTEELVLGSDPGTDESEEIFESVEEEIKIEVNRIVEEKEIITNINQDTVVPQISEKLLRILRRGGKI